MARFRLNYSACVSGIWGSVLSKPVTYSWNELLFFIDIIFCISQCWLRSPVVLVLDILQTLNKLHSGGSIKISFSGKRSHSVRRNHLLVQQNTGHSWESEKNFHICIDILRRFHVYLEGYICLWTPLPPVCLGSKIRDGFGVHQIQIRAIETLIMRHITMSVFKNNKVKHFIGQYYLTNKSHFVSDP